MKIHHAQFLKSALKPEDYPRDRRPEIAFVGRSNVGKSTLLNTLLGRKGLAKTSGTPGKTQTINFFDVNEKFYFVDLPGYGYAKVPKDLKEAWQHVMTEYLRNRDVLRMAVALVDARHAPSPQDDLMIQLLEDAEVPTLLVATKLDKVKRSQRAKALRLIHDTLHLEEDSAVLPVSSQTGEGIKTLWEIIEEQAFD